MRNRNILSALVALYCTLVLGNSAAAVDFTCIKYDDTSRITTIREHLDEQNVPHYVNEKTTICVAPKYKHLLHNLAYTLFPPNPDNAKQIDVPTSPSGIPLESIKLMDLELHQKLKAKLTEQSIWFIEDESGTIWYEYINHQLVDRLSTKLLGIK